MTTKNIILAIALGFGSLTATLAQAHAKIEASEPKADSELATAPTLVRLHFNEKLEPAFSKIELLDAKNALVKLPKAVVDSKDAKAISAQVPALTPGRYLVRWSTMTHDGHKAKGEYHFKVK